MCEVVDMERKNPLSNELKVAAEIFHYNKNNEVIWLSKLVQSLQKKVSKNTISAALDTLFDWGIVKAEYGETDNGRAGRLFFISNEAKSVISELYSKYWENERNQD